MAIVSARNISNNITESVSDSLLQANFIQDFPKGTLLDVKFLTKAWQDLSKKKAKSIKNL